MEHYMGIVVALIVGVATLVLWLWNDVRYVLPARIRCLGRHTRLPPGSMGIPMLGEMLTFLWYFKFLGRPDEYINSKRRKFGDGVELYRTHLFGKPTIIACSPQPNKLILQSDENFFPDWPSIELIGTTALAALRGESHTRIRNLVVRVVTQPDSLRRIALMIQPRVVSALHVWSQKCRITVYDEVKKVILENIGKYLAGFEPGPVIDTLGAL